MKSIPLEKEQIHNKDLFERFRVRHKTENWCGFAIDRCPTDSGTMLKVLRVCEKTLNIGEEIVYLKNALIAQDDSQIIRLKVENRFIQEKSIVYSFFVIGKGTLHTGEQLHINLPLHEIARFPILVSEDNLIPKRFTAWQEPQEEFDLVYQEQKDRFSAITETALEFRMPPPIENGENAMNAWLGSATITFFATRHDMKPEIATDIETILHKINTLMNQMFPFSSGVRQRFFCRIEK